MMANFFTDRKPRILPLNRCLLFTSVSLSLILQTLSLSSISPADQLLNQASSSEHTILLPGIYDALSARIFADAGSKALFLSGFGITASLLGQPDVGVLTLTEVEATTRRCNQATPNDVPIIVDGDTGFGGTVNVRRTVRQLASAGAAAISIEDQVFPKQCTFLGQQSSGGIRVVDRMASVARLRTALAAKKEVYEKEGKKVLIVGRTDCRTALGFDEALSRCLAYEELGCDIVYAENLQSSDEYSKLRKHVTSKPLIMAQVQLVSSLDETHYYSLSDMTELGYDFGLWGISSLQAAVKGLQNVATEMHNEQGIAQAPNLAPFSTVKDVVGYKEMEDFSDKYYCE